MRTLSDRHSSISERSQAYSVSEFQKSERNLEKVCRKSIRAERVLNKRNKNFKENGIKLSIKNVDRFNRNKLAKNIVNDDFS